MNETSALIKELTSSPIAFQPIYKKLTGSFSAAILLSQVMYWHAKMGRAFYKTDEEFAEELCMTAKEFRTAKETLKSAPFLKTFRSGTPAKTHYEINYDLFVSSMKQCVGELTCPNGRIAQKVQTRHAQTGISRPAQMGVTNPETTPETTTKTIPPNPHSGGVERVILDAGLTDRQTETLRKWLKHCQERRSRYGETAIAALIEEWKDETEQFFEESVNYSIARNYRGLYRKNEAKVAPSGRRSTL
jgi:hypothetical protein